MEVRRLLAEYASSERHVCGLMTVPRSSCRYRSRRDDEQLRERLRELAREHPRFGYRRLHLSAAQRGDGSEPQAACSGCIAKLGLSAEAHEAQASAADAAAAASCRRPPTRSGLWILPRCDCCRPAIRVLGVIDTFTRQCLALEVAYQLPQPARDTCARRVDRTSRKAASDSL